MCYYTGMEKNAKIAIGVGAGYLIWSRFKGIISLLWLIFVIIVIWAVVSDPSAESLDAKTAFIVPKNSDPAVDYIINQKQLRVDEEVNRRFETSRQDALKWAVTADLDAVVRNARTNNREILQQWNTECREAVRLNSVATGDGITWCVALKIVSER